MRKNILIICYSFPPYPGIGGRRWAKFSKIFAETGYNVHVIHADPLHRSGSLWLDDVSSENIIKHPVRFPFQNVLNNSSPNFLQKYLYRIIKPLMMLTKHSPFDNASLGEKIVVEKAIRLIAQYKIENLIVTGGPSEFYFGTLIKEKTGVNLILDYRDLHSDHSFFDKHWKWTLKQKKYWEKIENLAINSSDAVVAVDDSMIQLLRRRCSNPKVKFITISNGYDPDDYRAVPMKPIDPKKHYTLFFAGGIALDLSPLAKGFLHAFAELKKQNFFCYNKFRIVIYGDIENSLIRFSKSLQLENIKVAGNPISKAEYMAQLYAADAGIVFLSEEYAGAFITKFYDYLYLRKYVVNVGYPGAFSEFIHKNGIGFSFSPDPDWKSFVTLLNKLENRNEQYLPDHFIEQFSIANLANEYKKILS